MTARGVSDGPNGRALDETLAETGPGLSDDAVLDGELRPGDLEEGAEAAAAKLRRDGWAPGGGHDAEAAAEAEAATEAHPS